MNEQEPTTIAGYDIAHDFIVADSEACSGFAKHIIKMKLAKEEELKVLSAVAKRINDYVHHESIKSLSK